METEQRVQTRSRQHSIGSSRRYAIGALSAALIAIVIAASRFSVQAAQVRFEVRLAEDASGPGLQRIDVFGGRTVYLHPEFVLSNSDIAGTIVVPGDTYGIDITITDTGAAKIFAATRGHVGKHVVILIDGQVVAAPVLRSPIRNSARISGNFTRADAERIATGVIGK
jgi:preprotein translocase subunit SecD